MHSGYKQVKKKIIKKIYWSLFQKLLLFSLSFY